jgi:hypothetical protein
VTDASTKLDVPEKKPGNDPRLAWRSGVFGVGTEKDRTARVDVFPARSVAIAANRYVTPDGMVSRADHTVRDVPGSASRAPNDTRRFCQPDPVNHWSVSMRCNCNDTFVTPRLSVAKPLNRTGLDTLAPAAGRVICTCGARTSARLSAWADDDPSATDAPTTARAMNALTRTRARLTGMSTLLDPGVGREGSRAGSLNEKRRAP